MLERALDVLFERNFRRAQRRPRLVQRRPGRVRRNDLRVVLFVDVGRVELDEKLALLNVLPFRNEVNDRRRAFDLRSDVDVLRAFGASLAVDFVNERSALGGRVDDVDSFRRFRAVRPPSVAASDEPAENQ